MSKLLLYNLMISNTRLMKFGLKPMTVVTMMGDQFLIPPP